MGQWIGQRNLIQHEVLIQRNSANSVEECLAAGGSNSYSKNTLGSDFIKTNNSTLKLLNANTKLNDIPISKRGILINIRYLQSRTLRATQETKISLSLNMHPQLEV